jgi:hypothetical protein
MREFRNVAYFALLSLSVAALGTAADDVPGNLPEIKTIEEKYEKAVVEIEADAAKRMKEVEESRIKGYRTAIEKMTKAGDLDKAITLRDRLKEYEEASELTQPAPAGSLKIISATYGVNQSWFDVTNKLKKKIGSKGKWSSEVKDEDFGDPAPNFSMGNTLVVRYAYQGRVHVKAEYQGRQMRIP